MASKKKFSLAAFHQENKGGSEEIVLPTAPRGSSALGGGGSRLRGDNADWKASRGGGRGGSSGGGRGRGSFFRGEGESESGASNEAWRSQRLSDGPSAGRGGFSRRSADGEEGGNSQRADADSDWRSSKPSAAPTSRAFQSRREERPFGRSSDSSDGPSERPAHLMRLREGLKKKDGAPAASGASATSPTAAEAKQQAQEEDSDKPKKLAPFRRKPEETFASSASSKPKPNPFGAAKPAKDEAPAKLRRLPKKDEAEEPANLFNNLDNEDDEEEQPAAPGGVAPAPAPAPADSKESKRAVKYDEKLEQKSFRGTKKSELEQALQDETTVTTAQLEQGIESFNAKPEKISQLASCLLNSIVDKKTSLAAIVNLLTAKKDKDASAILVALSQIALKKKSELFLLDLIKEAKVDLYGVIVKGLPAEQVDKFLSSNGLAVLKPVADLTEPVLKALEGKQGPVEALNIIKAQAGDQGVVAYLITPVGEALGAKAANADQKTPNNEVLDSFRLLLARIMRGDITLEVKFLYALTNTLPKDSIKAIFQKLHKDSVVSPQALLKWRDHKLFEEKDKKKLVKEEKAQIQKKQDAIMRTNMWLDEVAEVLRKAEEPEEEEPEEDAEEEEDGEEDPYLQNPNKEFFK